MDANGRYSKKNYDVVRVVIPKGFNDTVKKIAADHRLTVSKAFLNAFCAYYNVEPPVFPTDLDKTKRIYKPYGENDG